MKLDEIFDSSVNLIWQHKGRFESAGFSINGFEYVIQVHIQPLPFEELEGKKTAEVSFFRNIQDAEQAHSTTHEHQYPAAVYGVVLNALKQKFQEYDAFYFKVLKRHSSSNEEFESKRKIYSFVTDRLAKDSGAHILEKDEHDGVLYLVTKTGVVSEDLVDRWDFVQSLVEKLEFTPLVRK